jgi:hypothetical protein
MWGKLRSRMTYANVVATLALFLVVAGGGAYAAFKLKPNSVKSKHIAPDAVQGVDVAESSLGKVPSAQSADTAGTAGTANAVAPNAVGPEGIQNPIRSVNLPLGAFMNQTDGTAFDFTPSNGGSPDFVIANQGLRLVWDDDSDGGGSDFADTDRAVTTFTIPQDYVPSFPTIAVRAHKDGHSGTVERIICHGSVNNVGAATASGVATTTAAASTSYTLAFGQPSTFAPGDNVDLFCYVDDGAFGDTYNDVVSFESVEFRYPATQ